MKHLMRLMRGIFPVAGRMPAPREVNQFASFVFLFIAFLTSLMFYGTGTNLLVLLIVAGSLLISLSAVGPKQMAALLISSKGSQISVVALVYLCFSYHWSLSLDTSFAPSWVLAALPMTFILVASYELNIRRLLLWCIMGTVMILATVSVFRFLLFGERAQQPMADANNYATLMYLCWIPLVHFHLSRLWVKPASSVPRKPIYYYGPYFLGAILLVAAFATYSRAAIAIVTGAILIWIGLAILRRFSLIPVLTHVGIALFAYVVVSLVTPFAGNAGGQFNDVSQSLNERMAIIGSALQMLPLGPFFGIGVFCFPLLYPAFRPYVDQDTAGYFVHNDYVQFLVEGGVPLLILLLIFILWVAFQFWRSLSGTLRDLPKAGPAMAVCAAAVHANVNFVFYSLTLSIFISVLAGTLVRSHPRGQTVQSEARSSRRFTTGKTELARFGVWTGLIFGWLCFGYLLLDTMIYGVFQGQKGLPLAADIRKDPARTLEFARVAQKLNSNRGVPVLAEALIIAHQSNQETQSRFLRERALKKFRQAEQVDPWNPQVYVEFARFLATTDRSDIRLREGEGHEELLLKAISLNPLFIPAIDDLLALFATSGENQKRYALLRNVVYPWMSLLQRRQPETAGRYLIELQKFARIAKDGAFLKEIEQRLEKSGSVEHS